MTLLPSLPVDRAPHRARCRSPRGWLALALALALGASRCDGDGAAADAAAADAVPAADAATPGDTGPDGAAPTDSLAPGDARPGADSPDAGPASLAERLCAWHDDPRNPLIEPPEPEFLLGDPTLVAPADAPDGRYHLFANSLLGIHHHVSDDGILWERLTPALIGAGAFRPYVFVEDGVYHLFYEQFRSLESSEIRGVQSPDLETWSEPTLVLTADLPWERTRQATVSNPYVTRQGGEYWLYYSADGVWLDDTQFSEPRVIGRARAASLAGPWVKDPEPILEPDPALPTRNLGAGCLKFWDEPVDGLFIAFQNGIYRDPAGASRSAIHVLSSPDGVAWQDVCGGPVIAPEGEGWKRAFVYAFDTLRVGDEIWAYYNARDGWQQGTERIGRATLALPPAVR